MIKVFFIRVFIITIVLILSSIAFSYFTGQLSLIKEFLIAIVINLISASAGTYWLIRKKDIDPKKFLNVVLSVMVVRLFSMLIVIFLCIKFLTLDKLVFTIAFFAAYIIYLIPELKYLTKSLNKN